MNESKPKERQLKGENEKVHHSTDWYYFTNFDKEFRLADQDEMPTWDIIEDPNIVEYSWTSMTPAQELDPHEEQGYNYDDTDRLMDPIDLSKFGYKSKMDKAKLIDIPALPHDVDWEFTQNQMKTDRWATFRYTPELFYQMAHLRNETKILFRNSKPILLPSLWAYYETLPTWCRDNPFIRAVLMGLEVSSLI